MPTAIWHGEDASLGGSAIGQLVIAEATAAQVKVVLTGEGSDEIFGGYSWYSTLRILQPLFLLPQSLRRRMSKLGAIRRRWPGAAATLAGAPAMDFERYAGSVTHLFSQAADKELLSRELQEQLRLQGSVQDAPAYPAAFRTWHPFAQMQYLDLKNRLGDGVVQSLDRMSMAYSGGSPRTVSRSRAGRILRAHSTAGEDAVAPRKACAQAGHGRSPAAGHHQPQEMGVSAADGGVVA